MLKKTFLKITLSFLTLAILMLSNASAYNTPLGFNWGATNILDGIIPKPGLSLSSYVLGYSAEEFKNGQGGDMPGNHDLDIVGYIPQFVYVSGNRLPGSFKYGIQAQMPFLSTNLDSRLPNGQEMLTANDALIGDLCIGPFFGRTEKLGKNWILHWFFEFDVYAPTGQYDQEDNINTSANYWSLEPFISLTLQMPRGFTLSSRQLFNLYNSENDEYIPPGKTRETELEVGNLYHFNYSLMKTVDFIDPNLRAGIVGYYGKQLEKDKVQGASNQAEERVFAIGPGLHWRHKGIIWRLKTFFESEAENRTQGSRIVLRIINHF